MSFGKEPVWEDVVANIDSSTRDYVMKNRFADWDIITDENGKPHFVSKSLTPMFLSLPYENQYVENDSHYYATDGTLAVSFNKNCKSTNTFDKSCHPGITNPDLVCNHYSVNSDGTKFCDSYWNASYQIPSTGSLPYGYDYFNNASWRVSPGYYFSDAVFGYNVPSNVDATHCRRNNGFGTVGTSYDGKKYGGANKYSSCLQSGSKCCGGKDDDVCQAEIYSWNSCSPWMQDNHYKFDPFGVKAGVKPDINQNMVNYYTPAYMQQCNNKPCVDQPDKYINLHPKGGDLGGSPPYTGDSGTCKRGYNWGILDDNNMWVSGDCSSDFVIDNNVTSCHGKGDYSANVCSISNEVYNAKKTDNMKYVSTSNAPACYNSDGSYCGDATNINSKFGCKTGCSTFKPKIICKSAAGEDINPILGSDGYWKCPSGGSVYYYNLKGGVSTDSGQEVNDFCPQGCGNVPCYDGSGGTAGLKTCNASTGTCECPPNSSTTKPPTKSCTNSNGETADKILQADGTWACPTGYEYSDEDPKNDTEGQISMVYMFLFVMMLVVIGMVLYNKFGKKSEQPPLNL